jgi:C-terminal processing protease CtpA/Prc
VRTSELVAGCPVARAGKVRIGDVLVEVNGKGVRGLNFNDVVQHMAAARRAPAYQVPTLCLILLLRLP